jgi:exopolysaccharide production protein ExoY
MKTLSASSSCKIGHPAEEVSVASARSALPLWKRSLDIGCCLVALPVLLVCTLVAAIMTRVSSPGPIFFRQERVGLKGRRFKLYKFRTMHVKAEVTSHQNHFADLVRSNVPMHKLDRRGDPRLIPGAWLLRASGLDELPQILNVLKGEMSLVGPRPCIPYEYGQYSPSQRERFDAVPGLTGLWQVSGKNHTTFEEMVRLDIAYARRRSLGMDLKIMFGTLPALRKQIVEAKKANRDRDESTRKSTMDTVAPLAVR